MITRKATHVSLIITIILTVTSCGKNSEIQSQNSIFTSILPQKYFVKRIAGDTFEVNVLVGPGKSPATYEPTPEQVIKLGKSSILFTMGVPFEKAFLKNIGANIKNIKIIDTSRGIKKRYFKTHLNNDSHSHGENHFPEDKVEDPHTWLSPKLAQSHAKQIYEALISIKPEKKDVFNKNYKELINDLQNLHEKIKRTLAPMGGNEILVFHPAFGYFSDEYGLKQQAVEMGGKSPSPKVLTEIIENAKSKKVKVIFVQPEFSQKSAKAIAKAIGGVVISLNPLSPHYIENLSKIAQEIGESKKI